MYSSFSDNSYLISLENLLKLINKTEKRFRERIRGLNRLFIEYGVHRIKTPSYSQSKQNKPEINLTKSSNFYISSTPKERDELKDTIEKSIMKRCKFFTSFFKLQYC